MSQSHLFVSILVGLAADVRRPTEEPVPQKILDLSAEIAKSPGRTELYLTRAELHRQRQDWESSLADLEMAAGLPDGFEPGHLKAGELLVEIGRPQAALEKLEPLLRRSPDHQAAVLTRARALAAVGRREEARRAYERAMALLSSPSPDNYLEHARIVAGAGRAALKEAIAVLDQGIARLGPVVSLQLPAIEYELQLGRVDAAVARVEAIAAKAPRRDLWLRKKGEILQQAGRRKEARASFQAALAELAALPSPARESAAVREAEQQLRALLAGKGGPGRGRAGRPAR